MRRLIALVVLTTLLTPGLAAAQDAKPKPARPPIVQPKPVETPAPKTTPVQSYLALPPSLHPGDGFNAGGFSSGGLASGGLRSSLPVIGDPAPQCRATCAKANYLCLSTDDASLCSPRWATCVSTCNP